MIVNIYQYLKVFTAYLRILLKFCFSETFWIINQSINQLITCTNYRGAFAPKHENGERGHVFVTHQAHFNFIPLSLENNAS